MAEAQTVRWTYNEIENRTGMIREKGDGARLQTEPVAFHNLAVPGLHYMLIPPTRMPKWIILIFDRCHDIIIPYEYDTTMDGLVDFVVQLNDMMEVRHGLS
jgi:hypothetical protein